MHDIVNDPQRVLRPRPGTAYDYPTAFCGWGDEERDAIARVLDSNKFTQGSEVFALERELAAYAGRAHCVVVNSGSSANLVAVSALRHLDKIKEGASAIVPAVAWSTTYAPLVQHGIDLILADIDDSWNADPYGQEWGKASAEPKLVVFVPILGNGAGVAQWAQIAGVLDVPLLVDACESFGAMIGSRSVMSYGDIATTSFFWSHQISAIEGGAILTDDPDVDRACRILRAHGWTRDTPEMSGTRRDFDREYEFVAFGYNVRGLELHAAVAREQLKKIDAMRTLRQRNDALFRQLTKGLPIQHPFANGLVSPFCLPFLIPSPGARREVLANALRSQGIDCRPPTGGSFKMHPYGFNWAAQPTPRADDLHTRGMFLGNGPLDLAEPISRAVEVMKEVLC